MASLTARDQKLNLRSEMEQKLENENYNSLFLWKTSAVLHGIKKITNQNILEMSYSFNNKTYYEKSYEGQ